MHLGHLAREEKVARVAKARSARAARVAEALTVDIASCWRWRKEQSFLLGGSEHQGRANHWGLSEVCIQLASKALRPFRRTSEEGANATDDASLGKADGFRG